MPKAYLSGPITAPDDAAKAANIARFTVAEAELVARGYEVVNPCKNGEPPDAPWQRHMRVDVRMMLADDVDLVVMLEGWGRSDGAQEEHRIATRFGMRVVPLVILLSAP